MIFFFLFKHAFPFQMWIGLMITFSLFQTDPQNPSRQSDSSPRHRGHRENLIFLVFPASADVDDMDEPEDRDGHAGSILLDDGAVEGAAEGHFLHSMESRWFLGEVSMGDEVFMGSVHEGEDAAMKLSEEEDGGHLDISEDELEIVDLGARMDVT